MVLGNVIFFHVNQTNSLKRTEWESEAINNKPNNKMINRKWTKGKNNDPQNTSHQTKDWATREE
jgi:hypothetical protein